MNTDFVLKKTPSMARRIVELSNVCELNIDPEIRELAKVDVLTDADFTEYDFTPAQKSMVQNLIDYEFRAIIPNEVEVIMAAAKIAKIETIIISSILDAFNTYGNKVAFRNKVIFKKFSSKLPDDYSDFAKANRHGLLILTSILPSYMPLLANDFSKTVIIADTSTSNEYLISDLFPDMTKDLLVNNSFFKMQLKRLGFQIESVKELNFLMNIMLK